MSQPLHLETFRSFVFPYLKRERKALLVDLSDC